MVTVMINREMVIDAVGRLMADVTDGVWGLSDDAVHPAIAELLDALPTPGTTRPLIAEVDTLDLGGYIGYRMTVDAMQRLTIATVEQRGYDPGARRGVGANVTRVTFVERPGYHLDVQGWVDVYATADPSSDNGSVRDA